MESERGPHGPRGSEPATTAAVATGDYTLNAEQVAAVHHAKQGYNIFITGSGGNGKTVVFKRIQEVLEEQNKTVWVTAPTGRAAKNVDGITLHEFIGMGLADEPVDELVRRLDKRRSTAIKMRLSKRNSVLMIDEISMVHPTLLHKLDTLMRHACRNAEAAFGGWQVVFVGDFLQLPPVDKTGELTRHNRFVCQMEPLWSQTIDVVFVLRKSMRQKDDATYADLLSRARMGRLAARDKKLLTTRVKALFPDDGIEPTIIVPHRETANGINARNLQKLDPATEVTFASKTFYRAPLKKSSGRNGNGANDDDDDDDEELLPLDDYDKKHLENLCTKVEKDAVVPNNLALRTGAQVILRRNMKEVVLESDVGMGEDGADIASAVSLVNGSRGVVVSASTSNGTVHGASVFVKFIDMDEPALITAHEWVQTDRRTRREVVYTQVPLSLGWATTIHQSQGLTLDRARTCIDEKVFEEGQGYVALSRVRNLASLSLTRFNSDGIFANPEMVAFYRHLDGASDEVDEADDTLGSNSSHKRRRSVDNDDNDDDNDGHNDDDGVHRASRIQNKHKRPRSEEDMMRLAPSGSKEDLRRRLTNLLTRL